MCSAARANGRPGSRRRPRSRSSETARPRRSPSVFEAVRRVGRISRSGSRLAPFLVQPRLQQDRRSQGVDPYLARPGRGARPRPAARPARPVPCSTDPAGDGGDARLRRWSGVRRAAGREPPSSAPSTRASSTAAWAAGPRRPDRLSGRPTTTRPASNSETTAAIARWSSPGRRCGRSPSGGSQAPLRESLTETPMRRSPRSIPMTRLPWPTCLRRAPAPASRPLNPSPGRRPRARPGLGPTLRLACAWPSSTPATSRPPAVASSGVPPPPPPHRGRRPRPRPGRRCPSPFSPPRPPPPARAR